MAYNSAQEQIRRKIEFQTVLRKYEIKGHVTETKRSKQHSVEVCIRELQRRWYNTMFRTYYPRSMWSYGIHYLAMMMQITESFATDLQGSTPLEALTGETPDISQYL